MTLALLGATLELVGSRIAAPDPTPLLPALEANHSQAGPHGRQRRRRQPNPELPEQGHRDDLAYEDRNCDDAMGMGSKSVNTAPTRNTNRLAMSCQGHEVERLTKAA